MDYKKIEMLLDDYWNGVTTLEQEKELVEFFTKEDIPAHLKEYQPLFQFFRAEKDDQVSASFETNLMAALEKEQKKEVVLEAKVKRLWTPLLRIAATVVLVLGMFFMYQNYEFDDGDEFAMVDTFETPEEAYRETMKALQLVSKKIDKGSKTAIKAIPSAGIMTKVVKRKNK